MDIKIRKLLFHRKFLIIEVRKSWLRNWKFPLRFPHSENRTTATKKRSCNYDFQTSVIGISSEIDTFLKLCTINVNQEVPVIQQKLTIRLSSHTIYS